MGLCNPARPCPHNCPRRRLQIPSPFPWAIDHFIDLCPVCNAVLNYGRDHVATAALAAQARESANVKNPYGKRPKPPKK